MNKKSITIVTLYSAIYDFRISSLMEDLVVFREDYINQIWIFKLKDKLLPLKGNEKLSSFRKPVP